jgi:hypothetical protein
MVTAPNLGFVESSHQLTVASRSWSHQELLAAAERAEHKRSGWPIGLVLRNQGVVPMADGVEARYQRYDSTAWQDYWRLTTEGSFYVARAFLEDFEEPSFTSSVGHPEQMVWFDVRVFEITELILHSARLYRALGVPADASYSLLIRHEGLKGREFYTSTATRHVRPGRICQEDAVEWNSEITQDYVSGNLKSLVAEVAQALFVQFDFADIPANTIDQLVDEFLQ